MRGHASAPAGQSTAISVSTALSSLRNSAVIFSFTSRTSPMNGERAAAELRGA